jgi:hypothetical protein
VGEGTGLGLVSLAVAVKAEVIKAVISVLLVEYEDLLLFLSFLPFLFLHFPLIIPLFDLYHFVRYLHFLPPGFELVEH